MSSQDGDARRVQVQDPPKQNIFSIQKIQNDGHSKQEYIHESTNRHVVASLQNRHPLHPPSDVVFLR